jgi:hypothetical protein
MAWQPSRIVPGLTQYLAAKRLASVAVKQDIEAPRTDAAFAGPCSIQIDSLSSAIEPDRPLAPQCPPVKRPKVDERVKPQQSKSCTCEPDIIGSDASTTPAFFAASSAKSIDDLPPLLHDSLLPFQRDGVIFAINKGGRVIIADDMGLGSRIPILRSSLHAAHLPPQKPYRPFLFVGFCVIIGQSSSSCQLACALLGLRSWSVGYRRRFLPVPSRCGTATVPVILLALQSSNSHALVQRWSRRH